jgi:hypothetical protein
MISYLWLLPAVWLGVFAGFFAAAAMCAASKADKR